MPDRKKVMLGLMHHSGKEIPIPCDNCPYDDDEPYCSQRLAADALALLKEQEQKLNIAYKIMLLIDDTGEWSEEDFREYLESQYKLQCEKEEDGGNEL